MQSSRPAIRNRLLAGEDTAMRWLALLIVLIAALGAAAPALALPQAKAEAAYARGDYPTAFKLWLPLAEQGSARAQANIARMYERGEWVAPDKAMAGEWYRRAADQHAADAAMPAMALAPAANAATAASVQAPVQTIYTPLASRRPATASYPIVVPYQGPAPYHHQGHHHGHRH
jgi:TPR repeat protein